MRHVDTAAAAEAAQLEDTFQALILDLGLPDLEGLELMARMRRFEPELPVLVLSARDAIEHRLAGLQSGADDYLVKPFDLRSSPLGCTRWSGAPRAGLSRPSRRTVAPGAGQRSRLAGWRPVTLSRRSRSAGSPGGRRWALVSSTLVTPVYSVRKSATMRSVHIHNIRARRGGHRDRRTAHGSANLPGLRLRAV